MTHYRSLFDNEHIGAWDLEGRDVVVTISAVRGATITGDGGRTSKKPILAFDGKQKTMVCNKTNAKIIAGLYGNDTTAWVGKSVTLYPTTTQMGGEVKECIRVRPTAPTSKRAAQRPPAPEREPGSDEGEQA